MVYRILKDGQEVNAIVADDSFVTAYCVKNGFTFELVPDPEPAELTPAEQRKEAYNTQVAILWEGEELTVSQAAQKWQYYAAAGEMEQASAITSLIAETKKEIRAQWPDQE
jgi:hypothetical protein